MGDNIWNENTVVYSIDANIICCNGFFVDLVIDIHNHALLCSISVKKYNGFN